MSTKIQFIDTEDSAFTKMVENYATVFKLNENHPNEKITLTMEGSLLYFVTENGMKYTTDESNFEPKDWDEIKDKLLSKDGILNLDRTQNQSSEEIFPEEEDELLQENVFETSGENGNGIIENAEIVQCKGITNKTLEVRPENTETALMNVLKEYMSSLTAINKCMAESITRIDTTQAAICKVITTQTQHLKRQTQMFGDLQKGLQTQLNELKQMQNEKNDLCGNDYNEYENSHHGNPQTSQHENNTHENDLTKTLKGTVPTIEPMHNDRETIASIVRDELTKINSNGKENASQNNQSANLLAHQMKEAFKFEIVSKESGTRFDYKLKQDTKYDHFYNYFASELRTNDLLSHNRTGHSTTGKPIRKNQRKT
ncbi:uncharacterized protein LOC118647016 [Monomorium pharaonis]|uniref:uncharacterized protein LOC118647016 n=1 Tax=Monomorium pharaonis TaxID=307658 RepID=UPI001746962C|nr:uncharacterized protein LOC118647016 [Monomorium pharaonis]